MLMTNAPAYYDGAMDFNSTPTGGIKKIFFCESKLITVKISSITLIIS
jgi:hypothetical protein